VAARLASPITIEFNPFCYITYLLLEKRNSIPSTSKRWQTCRRLVTIESNHIDIMLMDMADSESPRTHAVGVWEGKAHLLAL